MAWLKDSRGEYLSPEKAKSARAREFKDRPQGDRYLTRKLYRFCPECGAEIKIKRRIRRCDEWEVYRDTTAFICSKCHKAWESAQTVKIWQRLKRISPKIYNKKAIRKIEEGGIK